MLRSYFSFASHGEVILRREVLSQLAIGPEGVLYGALHPQETAAILSPIPPRHWGNALKVIIHTRDLPGSLAAAANAIAELPLDTISSWASNGSFSGHLCSTSIVVAETETLDALGWEKGIAERLEQALSTRLSDLVIFSEGMMEKIRVTRLQILAAYSKALEGARFCRVRVNGHALHLTEAKPIGDEQTPARLWSGLLEAGNTPDAHACILTPDTEEALLRVVPVSEQARLCRLSFHVSIQSERGSFAGYWQRALDRIANEKYSVYVANNLLISKEDQPPREEAKFNFVLDRRTSQDSFLPLDRLCEIWESRITSYLGSLAESRSDTLEISHLNLTRPRGVGVPCFVSTNAKPRDGIGARTAAELCRLLEGYGFIPVNVDLAQGGNLREQVKGLVTACRFMIVLYCPEERLLRADGQYGVSEWVTFEEGIMEAVGGEVHRIRFTNVSLPAYGPGFIETCLPEAGLDEKLLANLEERLERWNALMHQVYKDVLYSTDIDSKHFVRDLVAYYEGRS